MTLTYTPVLPPIVGDGVTDDTAAMQSFLDTMPNYTEIIFPQGCKPKFSASLLIQGRAGLRFRGTVGSGISANYPSQCGSCLTWQMNQPGTPMIGVYASRDICFENLGILYMGGANPSVGIDIDRPQGTTGGFTVTNNGLINCYIGGPALDCGFICLRNAWQSPVNCDFTYCDRCSFAPSGVSALTGIRTGIGFLNGPQYNAKGIRLSRCGFLNCGTGIWMQNGSIYADDLSGEMCDLALRISATAGPMVFGPSPAGWENLKTFLRVDGMNSPIFIEGHRIASLSGPGIFQLYPGCATYIHVRGCTISVAKPGQTAMFDHSIGNSTSTVCSEGNVWGVPMPNPVGADRYYIPHRSDVYS